MPAPTVQAAILYRALRLSGVTMGPGRTASPDQLSDALLSLNGLVDYLNAQEDAVYSKNYARYTLFPSKTHYTIGIDPTGALTPDFAVARPARIEEARLVLTSSPSPIYLPLRIVNDTEWSSIVVRQIPVTIPQVMFCDYDWPLANLWFWGYPTQSNDLELWSWNTLTPYATVTDPVTIPPGYTDMLVYQLAARLQDQFVSQLQVPFNPNLWTQANRMLGRVKAVNTPAIEIGSADWGARTGTSAGGGYFNYLTGGRA